jgi:chromosome segregation ATPase
MSYQLTNSNDSQFAFILDQTNRNPKVEAALQPVLDARRRVADAQVALDAVNARLTDLRSDEERQRDNVTALASADKSSRERFVHELNATEDQIAAAQKDLTAAQTTLQSAKDDLADKIESLQVDQEL